MISDEERRRVAKALRENINRSRIRYDTSLVHEIVDVVGWDRLENGITDALADLIDRPTCELIELWDEELGEHRLDCSACHFGERAGDLGDEDPERYNSRRLWTDVDWQMLRYCPNCGAEVVSDGDD